MRHPWHCAAVPHERQVACGGVVERVAKGGRYRHDNAHGNLSLWAHHDVCHTKLQHIQLAQQHEVAAVRLIQQNAVK